MNENPRCPWSHGSELYQQYHDSEWGVPLREDRGQFEFLILEGAQAGLSWITILKKRENYRRAFDQFDVERVAAYDDKDRARLLADAGIVRNRLKIDAAIGNARACLRLRDSGTSLDEFLWRYVDGKPIVNRFRTMGDVPATTELSDRISRDLKKAGFRFVGSTIVYSFMQATGMVNDHLLSCPRHAALSV